MKIRRRIEADTDIQNPNTSSVSSYQTTTPTRKFSFISQGADSDDFAHSYQDVDIQPTTLKDNLTLTDSIDLQHAYIDIYKQVRKFYLPVQMVESLAYFEYSVFKRFPTKSEVEKQFDILKKNAQDLGILSYGYVQDAFDDFQKLLQDTGSIYNKILVVEETLPTDIIFEEDEEKEVYHIGDIKKSDSEESEETDEEETDVEETTEEFVEI